MASTYALMPPDHISVSLSEGERQLRLALRAGAMGLWRIDLATSRAQWDDQVHRLQGWQPGTFPGTWEAFCSRVHPEDLPAVQEASHTCNELRRDFTVEFRVIWPDGTIHWIEDHGILDFDADGRLTGITGLSMDITARKEAEAAMRTAREQAERASAAKGEFLSRTSHELRTPLNAILGFGQLLEVDELEERQRQCVDHILAAGRKLLGMVDKLLVVARGQSGRRESAAKPEAIPTMEALAKAKSAVEPLATELGVFLHVPDDGPSGAVLLAQPEALQEILVHLLRNAIQYHSPGGQVWLRAVLKDRQTTQVNDGRVRLCVQDNGPGISPVNQKRLFVPFERLGAEQRGTVLGAGLGLATSRQLAEEMGGSLGVSSEVGEGSTFWIELPLAV